MKTKIFCITFIILALYSSVFAQSFKCTPEHVVFASNGGSIFTVEKTTVSWKRIDYHINGDTAFAITYENLDDPATDVNSSFKDEMIVLENSPDRIILMKKKVTDMMELTVDVIFPKDGNGYTFYVSDYPKTRMLGKSDLKNLSKLYMLKCQYNPNAKE